MLLVSGKDALDFVAGYVLSVGLDVDAGLGRIGRVDGEDDWAGGAADGFEELLDDGPINQNFFCQVSDSNAQNIVGIKNCSWRIVRESQLFP